MMSKQQAGKCTVKRNGREGWIVTCGAVAHGYASRSEALRACREMNLL